MDRGTRHPFVFGGESDMNEDCLIRLENQMYECGGDRAASKDRYSIEEYIRDLELQIRKLERS